MSLAELDSVTLYDRWIVSRSHEYITKHIRKHQCLVSYFNTVNITFTNVCVNVVLVEFLVWFVMY